MDKFFRAVKKIHRESVKASNRAERERRRQERENRAYYNALQRDEDIQDASLEVARWNSYIKAIQSLHKNCSDSVDWAAIEAMGEPEKIFLKEQHTLLAQTALYTYKPTLIHKLFNQTHKKRKKLEDAIQKAKNQDVKDFEEAQKVYDAEYNEWEKLNNIAKGIRANKPQSYLDTIKHFGFLSSLSDLGTRFELNILEDFIDIDLHVSGEDIIPKFVLSQAKTGKLSKKNMTKTMFYELYQDHVCSAALRVAREVFAHLPIERLRINALSKIVDSKTGHLEDSVILSAIIPRGTLRTLNLGSIDPSDSMQNFVHTMSLRKTLGFRIVEKVELKI